MNDVRHFFYLHGFTSSARSTKARYLAERLEAHGLSLECPDFNEPDFASLTISRMIEQVIASVAALPAGPVSLIGSSLGGLVALHVASRHIEPRLQSSGHTIDRLILLAPAVRFHLRDDPHVGPKIDEWRRTNALEVFHYAYGEPRTLGFEMFEDAERRAAARLDVPAPMLIFQGTRDASVNPATVEPFAREQPNATLRLFDDDHQLLGSLDRIWREASVFLELDRA